MWDIIFKAALSGIILGAGLGYFEKNGNKDAKLVGDGIEDFLDGLFRAPAPRHRGYWRFRKPQPQSEQAAA